MDPLWAGAADVSLLTELLLGPTRGSAAHGHCHAQIHGKRSDRSTEEGQEADL